LPSGCVFQLDQVVRGRVLESLKRAMATAAILAAELRQVAGASAQAGSGVTLGHFLDETGRDVDDVYERAGGWSTLRSNAGIGEKIDEDTEDLSGRLKRLLHTDDATRLLLWKNAAGAEQAAANPVYARRLSMVDFQLNERGILREAADVPKWLFDRAPIRDELSQLSDVLTERIGLADETDPVAEWPLALHRHYKRREIVAAVGFVMPGKKGVAPQAGILGLPDEKRETLFVTLDKSGSSFSPTTRDRDYAISPTLFHWETQSAACISRPSGRRYLESPQNGWSFFLFVRSDPESPYAFLGPVVLEAASGQRRSADRHHVAPGARDDRRAVRAVRDARAGLSGRAPRVASHSRRMLGVAAVA